MNDAIPRREFLAATAFGLALPSLLAQTEAVPPHHGAIVGHGSFQYKVDKLWSKADRAKTPVKDCHEMTQSGDGRLFLITNLKQNNVIVFKRVEFWIQISQGTQWHANRGADLKEGFTG